MPGFQHHNIQMSSFVVDQVLNSRSLSGGMKSWIKKTFRANISEKDKWRKHSAERSKQLMTNELVAAKPLDMVKLRELLLKPQLRKLEAKSKAFLENKDMLKILNQDISGAGELSKAFNLAMENSEDLGDFLDTHMGTINNQIDEYSLRSYGESEIKTLDDFHKFKANILKNIDLKERFPKIGTKSTTWTTHGFEGSETNEWAKFMKANDGVLTVSAKELGLKGDVFEFNINSILEGMHMTPKERELASLSLNGMFDKMASLQKDSKNPRITKVKDGLFHASQMSFIGPTRVEDLVDPLTNELGHETYEHTQLRRVMDAVDLYDRNRKGEFGTEGRTVRVAAIDHDVAKQLEAQKVEMTKMMLNYFLTPGRRNSPFKMSGQMVYARNAFALVQNAHNLTRTGAAAALTSAGLNAAENETDFRRILNKVMTAKPNEVFMSSEMLDKLVMDPSGLGLGAEADKIEVAKFLQKQIKSGGEDLLGKLRKGEEGLTGIMTRYPNEPQGNNAASQVIFNFIPEKYRDLIGMDKEDAYLFSIYGNLQKIDYDGDKIALAIRGFSTVQRHAVMMKESREHWQKQMYSLSWQMDNFMTPLGTITDEKGNQKVRMLTYDDKNGGSLTHVDLDYLEAQDRETMSKKFLGEHYSGFTFDSVAQTAEMLNAKTFTALRAKAALGGVMKDSIGMFTNAVEIAEIKNKISNTNPRVSAVDLSFNMQHGLGALLQNFTDLQKRGTYDDVFKVANKFKVLMGDLSDRGVVQEVRQQFINSYGDLAYGMEKAATNDRDLANVARNAFLTDHKSQTYLDVAKDVDRFIFIQGMYKEATSNNKLLALSTRERVRYIMNNKSLTMTDLYSGIGSEMTEDQIVSHIDKQHETAIKSGMDALESHIEMLQSKFSKTSQFFDTYGKNLGKFGIIGAGVYLGATMLNPSSRSDSIGPYGLFDSMSENNIVRSDLELERSIPLDAVNPAFNNSAFVRMQDLGGASRQSRGKANMELITDDIAKMNSNTFNIANNRKLRTKDYTSYIGNFGSTNIERRSNYK
jgi:flagellar motor component MotA